MNMIFKAIAKKLFGVKYERLTRTVFVYLVVFWGLRIADFRVQIAPAVLYLMVSTFSAGIMWQALSSEDNRVNMRNMLMLPFEGKSLVFSYIAALGVYTLFTRTAGLLAVLLAVSTWSGAEIPRSILCAVNAVLVTGCVYPRKRFRIVMGGLWAGAILAVIFLRGKSSLFILVLIVSCLSAILILNRTDAYSFFCQAEKSKRTVKGSQHYSVWRYLLRYLMAHKNYLFNTAAMWCVACVLPILFRQTEGLFGLLAGFAILTLNTPICILLSCDTSLEQAVRFLPNQKRLFVIPYCLFIFVCNMTADMVFLCSWRFQLGGINGAIVLIAAGFALLSAIGSVLLEWYFPIRGWKIESDLWHHPRKYIVPAIMFLLAGLITMAA